jgi:hypothetical protein
VAEKKKYLLRIDEALWNEIQAWAADELRSANGQIEYLLREAVRARRGGKPPAPPAPPPAEESATPTPSTEDPGAPPQGPPSGDA